MGLSDPFEAMRKRAAQQTALWQRDWLRRVRALRAAERLTASGLATSIQRSAGEILLSFLVKHETFRRGGAL